MNSYVSQNIRLVSSLAMIGVVMIHSKFITSEIWASQIISLSHSALVFQSVISEGLARISVPLFFTISGFLFYNHTARYGWKQILNRKWKSVIIPYLIISGFWTCFILIKDRRFDEIIYIFLLSKVAYQLWFLRILMIGILFAILLRKILRNPSPVILVLLVIFLFDPYTYRENWNGIIFFLLGGSLTDIKFSKYQLWLVALILVLSFVIYEYNFIQGNFSFISLITHKMFILTSLYLIWYVILHKTLNLSVASWRHLSKYTVFFYLFHEPLLGKVKSIMFYDFDFALSYVYVLAPLIVMLILFCVYYLVNSVASRFLTFILGGR